MAAKRLATKKISAQKARKPEQTKEVIEAATSLPQQESSKDRLRLTLFGRSIPLIVVIPLLVLILLVGFLITNRQLYLAAIVNGQPITKFELYTTLEKQYGKQALPQIVNEVILRQAAARENITVTQKEIDDKIAEMSKTLPKGMSLDDALKAQGLSRSDLKKIAEVRVLINKLVAKSVTVTDKEVNEYIKDKREQLTATKEAEMKEEAKNLLTQQKTETEFRKWFDEENKKAKVETFL